MNPQISIVQRLAEHFLFKNCSDDLLNNVAQGATTVSYAPGEALKKYREPPFLCILLSGEAVVHTRDENNDLLLRVLRTGDTFGVAELFNGQDMVTRVTATKHTEALCIGEETVRAALMSDGQVSMRYIAFLSDRIRFLNHRISTLTAGSAERRLAAWLDTVAPEGTDTFELPVPMNRLADLLGVGRASLYRAMDELTARGYLLRDGKTIRLPDRDAMRRDVRLS